MMEKNWKEGEEARKQKTVYNLPLSDLFTDEQKDMLRRVKKDGDLVLKDAPSEWKKDKLFMVDGQH